MIGAHPVGNTLKRMAAQVAAISLVFLLFLPFIGPQLDHHFAERRPDHVHVYLGDVLPDHTHSFEGRHVHYHLPSGQSMNSGDPSERGPAQGIVYLTSDEGLGQGSVDLTSRLIQQLPLFPGPDDVPRLFDIGRGDAILSSAFVAPPKKPPRS
jgi:hypothetical protein